MSKSPEESAECLKETEVAAHEDDDQYSYVDILEGSYLEMKRSNTDTGRSQLFFRFHLDKRHRVWFNKCCPCGCRTTASTSAFQAEDEGSTPFTCSTKKSVATQVAALFWFAGTHFRTHLQKQAPTVVKSKTVGALSLICLRTRQFFYIV